MAEQKTAKLVSGKKNILVTGGAGFIGSNLCDELVRENHVLCVDNFITGNESNIDHLIQNPNFEFIKHDIIEPLNLEESPEAKIFKVQFQGIQEIYHLACPNSPKEYTKFTLETILSNSHGTKNVLDLAVKYEAKLLFFSTDAIYGEPQPNQGAFKEDYWGYINHLGLRSCYDEGKRFAETLIVTYMRKYNNDTKILRLANTYGPRMRLGDGRVIPDYIASALKNEPIVIHGDQNSTSSFLYIKDLIAGISKFINSREHGPVNMGSVDEYRLEDIARVIIKLTGSSSKIKFDPPLEYTRIQGIPDISLAKERIGWFPLINLESGLRETIEAMKASRIYTAYDGEPMNEEEKSKEKK